MIQSSDDSIPRGFTLLEILVVLTIIFILAGMLLVAVHGPLRGGQTNQTKATLATLRGMLTEYENATHFQNAPVAWEWQVSGNSPQSGVVAYIVGSTTYPPPATADFWRIPSVNTTGVGGSFPDPLISPGLVVDGQNDRAVSVAVINTQIVMSLLASVPVNQATLAKMSSAVTMILPGITSGSNAISTGAELTNGTRPNELIAGLPDNASFDVLVPNAYGYGALSNGSSHQSVATTSSAVNYVQGVQVITITSSGQKAFFRNIGTGLNNGSFPGVGQSNGNWAPVTAPVPVCLDAWNNPIIFVPGSGLLVWSKSQGVQDNTGKWYVKPVLIQSPDHKPFFASAGPDGDFSSGDDNIYSFED